MIGGGDDESLVGRATFTSPAMAHAAMQPLHGIDMRSDSEKLLNQSMLCSKRTADALTAFATQVISIQHKQLKSSRFK